MGEWIWVLIPIMALMIPIIAMLIKHQTNMAQIIHGRPLDGNLNQNQLNSYNPQLTDEVRQLRELMQQQTIALDNLRNEVRSGQTIQERVNQNS